MSTEDLWGGLVFQDVINRGSGWVERECDRSRFIAPSSFRRVSPFSLSSLPSPSFFSEPSSFIPFRRVPLSVLSHPSRLSFLLHCSWTIPLGEFLYFVSLIPPLSPYCSLHLLPFKRVPLSFSFLSSLLFCFIDSSSSCFFHPPPPLPLNFVGMILIFLGVN